MIAERRLARAFLDAHPARAAMTLERMPLSQAAAVLHEVPAAVAANVLHDMNIPFASDCLTHLVNDGRAMAASAMLAELQIEDGAGIVRVMDVVQRQPLLDALPAEVRDPIVRVLPYDVGTAGSIMDPSIFRLPDDVLVADARSRLLRAARALLYYLYVVDRDQHLVGVLDIPELMIARARDRISVAMHREVERVTVHTPVALVRDHAGWQLFHALPVVDDEDRLLGAIRYQTLRRLERETSKDGPAPGNLTAGALAELFQLGTSGLVAGLSATA
ncbi:MAG: CBS domain-containing protein, partial [Gemmatimonas sp.]